MARLARDVTRSRRSPRVRPGRRAGAASLRRDAWRARRTCWQLSTRLQSSRWGWACFEHAWERWGSRVELGNLATGSPTFPAAGNAPLTGAGTLGGHIGLVARGPKLCKHLRRATVPSGGGGRRDAEHDVWAQVADIFPAGAWLAGTAGGHELIRRLPAGHFRILLNSLGRAACSAGIVRRSSDSEQVGARLMGRR